MPASHESTVLSHCNEEEQKVAHKVIRSGGDSEPVLLKNVKSRIGAGAFSRWFGEARVLTSDAECVEIEVPDAIHQLWIEDNFMDVLTAIAFEIHSAKPQISIVVADGAVTNSGHDDHPSTKELVVAEVAGEQPKRKARSDSEKMSEKQARRYKLNTVHTFENFVDGCNTRFAVAAAWAVAEERGHTYNPLFIYGDSGLGKTHLMQAIGLERLRRDPKAKVIYVTSEEFTNDFINAVRGNKLEKFRNKYRKVDLLLLDDVQFLGGKEKSQEEFFHTFNSLFDSSCQIVMTSDCPASQIERMSARLVSRFEAGMTVEIMPPRLETREAIVQRKNEEWQINLQPEVVSLLVNRITSNVRRLVGALVRLATYTSLGEGQVTCERAEVLLRDILIEANRPVITIDSIQRCVVTKYDLLLDDMSSRRRPAHIAFPRQIAMYLSRKLTDCSLVQIGDAFGGRDHGTVLHAIKRVEAKLKTDGRLQTQLQSLVDELES